MMKRTTRIFLLILTLMLCTSAAVAEKTYTISEEDYKLLQIYRRLEEIKTVVDAQFLWEYDEDRLLEGAAIGMIGMLGDDYSYYLLPEEKDAENETIDGKYCGIGIEVYRNANDKSITIRRVFHGGPAQKAGILPGDKIVAVNGTEYNLFTIDDAISVMRGEEGGEVTVTVLRDQEFLEFECVRAFVVTEYLDSAILDDNIGYIRIYEFEGTAIEQLSGIIQDYLEKDVQGLIIDLRNNLGGLVHLATQIADVFIEDGIIMIEEDKFGRTLPKYAREGAWDIPLAVLVNKHSASASEILAAALQENGVATIVGEQTFGKGIVQTLHTFEDGAGMHITSGYWLTPNGNKIHKEGIAPDVEVTLAEDALDENYEIIREKDNQLQTAVDIVKAEMADR